MSSNNAYVIRKISENCFEVRYVACMDNDIPTDELPLEATCNNLEEAMKIANKEYTEYGVMYEDDSHKDVSKNNNEDITKIKAIIADGLYDMNDEEEFDKKILQKTIDDFKTYTPEALHFILINAIKEITEKNKELEERIIALENK